MTDESPVSSCVFKCFVWISLGVSVLIFIVRSVLRATTSPYPQLTQHESERSFVDPNKNNEKVKFPSVLSMPTIDLSIVVPSYNEEKRLPIMLDEALEYLEKRRVDSKDQFKYEIIIADDGSKDETTKVGLEYAKKYTTERVRVLTLAVNRGKGGAIRQGVFKCRGKMILFADADGASRFSDVEKLENALKKNAKKDIETEEIVVCGSRRHLEKDSVAKRSLFRTFLMYGFHFLVWFFCVKGIRDTQCGFKLFSRSAAFKAFSNLHIERWAFDVDLLYIASCFKMKILEVDINWQEIDGSKVTPASWIQMGKDILLIRMKYIFGAWKLNENLRMED